MKKTEIKYMSNGSKRIAIVHKNDDGIIKDCMDKPREDGFWDGLHVVFKRGVPPHVDYGFDRVKDGKADLSGACTGTMPFEAGNNTYRVGSGAVVLLMPISDAGGVFDMCVSGSNVSLFAGTGGTLAFAGSSPLERM